MIYLLCDNAISTLIKFNAHQHYGRHKDYKHYRGREKVDLQRLKDEMQKLKIVISSSVKTCI